MPANFSVLLARRRPISASLFALLIWNDFARFALAEQAIQFAPACRLPRS
jgi:hypothetical protein